MNEPEPSLWIAKPQLSDAAAVQLLDFLYELTTAFENAYYDQIHRYYASFDHSEDEQPSSQQPDPSQENPFRFTRTSQPRQHIHSARLRPIK